MKTEVFRISSRERNQKCKGSYKAGQDISSPATAASSSGTKIHTACEIATGHDNLVAAFAYDQLEYIEEAMQAVGAIGADMMQLNNFDRGYVTKAMSELANDLFEAKQRGATLLWSQREPHFYKASPDGKYAWSGHADLVICWSDRIDCYDWKTGPKDVVTTENNPQLQGYAPLLTNGGKPVRIHIMARGNEVFHTFTTIPVDMLAVIEAQMEADALACLEPDAKRECGEWCTYCPAKCTQRCPESMTAITAFTKASIEQRDISAILEWEPGLKAAWIHRYKIVRPMFEAAYEALKADAANGNVPGYTISKYSVREITDMGALASALLDKGVNAATIIRACNISVGDLEDVYIANEQALSKLAGEKPKSKKDIIAAMNKELADAGILARKEASKLVETKGDAA